MSPKYTTKNPQKIVGIFLQLKQEHPHHTSENKKNDCL